MFFAPYVIRGSNAEKVLVQILPASPEDLAATKGTPSWQTDWESEYLSQPSVDKFALKMASCLRWVPIKFQGEKRMSTFYMWKVRLRAIQRLPPPQDGNTMASAR